MGQIVWMRMLPTNEVADQPPKPKQQKKRPGKPLVVRSDAQLTMELHRGWEQMNLWSTITIFLSWLMTENGGRMSGSVKQRNLCHIRGPWQLGSNSSPCLRGWVAVPWPRPFFCAQRDVHEPSFKDHRYGRVEAHNNPVTQNCCKWDWWNTSPGLRASFCHYVSTMHASNDRIWITGREPYVSHELHIAMSWYTMYIFMLDPYYSTWQSEIMRPTECRILHLGIPSQSFFVSKDLTISPDSCILWIPETNSPNVFLSFIVSFFYKFSDSQSVCLYLVFLSFVMFCRVRFVRNARNISPAINASISHRIHYSRSVSGCDVNPANLEKEFLYVTENITLTMTPLSISDIDSSGRFIQLWWVSSAHYEWILRIHTWGIFLKSTRG